jgi:putative ABC transport system permease protein
VVGILDPVPLAPEVDRSALVGWPAAQRYLGFDRHPTTLYERSTDETVNEGSRPGRRLWDRSTTSKTSTVRP